jgi:23S rRNA pseudouridine1911/1915/1917 synthase
MQPADTGTFRVADDQAGATLAAALRAWLPNLSWSQAERLVRSRRALVNGNLCLDAGRRLAGGEVVKLLPHSTAPVPTDRDVRVRHADAHVVVVEKPAGMTSTRHSEEQQWPARRKQLQPTLDELLPRILARRERRATHGEILRPVRAVHRLDRDTSGLMVFARTMKAEQILGQQFKAHTIERRYRAVVRGHPAAQTIATRLVRDRGDGRRGSSPDGQSGQRAVTHLRPLERLGDYELVECQLETGRTHQIRIHLAELGHPVCGDKVYSQPLRGKPRPDTSGAPRLALHAAVLGFAHPASGEFLRFEMPLPRDLAELVKRLRRGGAGG